MAGKELWRIQLNGVVESASSISNLWQWEISKSVWTEACTGYLLFVIMVNNELSMVQLETL